MRHTFPNFRTSFPPQVNHVRTEERFACGRVVGLARVKQAVHPRQQLSRAVVGVQDHRNAIRLSQGAHVVGPSDGTKHCGLLVVQRQRLPGIELGASIGELNDDWGVDRFGRFQHGIDAVAANDVDGRKCVSMGFGVGPNLADLLAREDA